MELISRRRVLEYIADYHWNNRGIAMDWSKAIDDIFAEVEKMPTIESRPKGVWVENKTNIGMGYSCPICGTLKVHKHNYCEECGAKMGEE